MPQESYAGKIQRKLLKKQRIIDVASGREKADLVLKNATYVNVFSNELCKGDIACAEGLIVGIGDYQGKNEVDVSGKIVCPGFIDAHVHLESSLVSPREFARAVLPHGTTCVITDPHEITNVMGTDGIDYMLGSTEELPVDVMFMLPSCVPATPLDEAGANLDWHAIDSYFTHPRVLGLAEMMNAYGVIHSDSEPLSKIIASQAHHKKIDGHAPGLEGMDLNAYVAAGVYSDHECSSFEDALRKLRIGQFVMIREGTAARNLDALAPLLCEKYASRCMFCTDDSHPSDLLDRGHIDSIIRRAVRDHGVDPILAVKVAAHYAARYFLLNNRGAIAPGYLADLNVIDSFDSFTVEKVYKRGVLAAENGKAVSVPKPVLEEYLVSRAHDTFRLKTLSEKDFESSRRHAVIGMVDGEILTTDNGYADLPDTGKDILRIAVVERHKGTGHIGLGFLQGYGLKEGAVATSISHDSHNIIAVGVTSGDMALAVNRVAENKGGIVVVKDGQVTAEVQLEIAGLMSDCTLEEMNEKLEHAKRTAFAQGVQKNIDPFMTLSFMSLPVIPSLRLTTRGVIDVNTQQYL